MELHGYSDNLLRGIADFKSSGAANNSGDVDYNTEHSAVRPEHFCGC
jgi:hypothetical protein